MKRIRMTEFQYVQGGDSRFCISNQFYDWLNDDFNCVATVLQIAPTVIKNADGKIVETVFVLYEIEESK